MKRRELKRLSPCALANWTEVFPLLSPSLRHLSLRGQLLTDHVERLLRRAAFNLVSLDVEDCGLAAADMAFLARSRHRNSLAVLRAGDFDLGDKFMGLVQLLKGMKQLESLSLCMEGFDRYADDVSLDGAQAMELVYLIRQQFTRTMKCLSLGGGHPWSKSVLLKAIKHLVPMSSLCRLTLPVDGTKHITITTCLITSLFPFAGLSEESVESYRECKKTDVGFKYKLERCGTEYKELQMATLTYLRKGVQVTASLCREGMLLQLQPMPGPRQLPRRPEPAPFDGVVLGPKGERRTLDPLYTKPFPTSLATLPLDADRFLMEQTRILEETNRLLLQQTKEALSRSVLDPYRSPAEAVAAASATIVNAASIAPHGRTAPHDVKGGGLANLRPAPQNVKAAAAAQKDQSSAAVKSSGAKPTRKVTSSTTSQDIMGSLSATALNLKGAMAGQQEQPGMHLQQRQQLQQKHQQQQLLQKRQHQQQVLQLQLQRKQQQCYPKHELLEQQQRRRQQPQQPQQSQQYQQQYQTQQVQQQYQTLQVQQHQSQQSQQYQQHHQYPAQQPQQQQQQQMRSQAAAPYAQRSVPQIKLPDNQY